MDFDHLNSLMIVEEQSLFDCVHCGDPLTVAPPLLSETTDGLIPLPDSLDDHFNDLSYLSSSNPIEFSSSLPLVPHSYYDHTLGELSFDDINLDSFSWDNNNNNSQDYFFSDAVPLNSIPPMNPCEAYTACGGGGGGGGDDQEKHTERRAIGRSKLSEIGLDEIRCYFYMPITRAAKEMNVGLTVLKKRCRELGILRWPHRKMKSLNTLIHNVQELGKGTCEQSIRSELETLEEHRRLMEENPEIQLTERTKKLRQACFKANYKRRRAMQRP